MQAIILAAGMGKRLKELTQNNTKCMVKVNGVTLIDRMLHQIDGQHLSRIVIVVGYEGQKLIDYIATLDINTPVIYINNPIYDKTNNIYSLSLASDWLCKDDTLLFESDLIFEDSVLKALVEDSRDTLALVDKYESWMDGTCVKLRDDDSIEAFVSKEQFQFNEIKEYYKTVNIYKFGRHFSETHYVPFLDAYSKALGNNEYYEQVLRVITMLDEPEIKAKRLNGELWYEIDDIQDLDIASSIFLENSDEKLMRMQKRWGGYWRYPKIKDFCSPGNPYFPPQKLMDEIKANLENLISEYPSGIEVNSLLAAKNLAVNREHIVVANGIEELIKSIMENADGKIGIIKPIYAEYINRYNIENFEIFVSQNPELSYSAEDIVDFFSDKEITMLILANPDYHTGNYIPGNELKKILNWCNRRNIKIILDESYCDFTDEEESSLLCNNGYLEYHGLVILKNLSVTEGVPGVRLGCAISINTDMIKLLKNKSVIWNINSIAEFYLQIEEKYQKDYKKAVNSVKMIRHDLEQKLSEIDGLKVIPSQTNYITCEVQKKYSAYELTKILLLQYNILIKDLTDRVESNRQYVKFAIRTQEENLILLNALRNVFLEDRIVGTAVAINDLNTRSFFEKRTQKKLPHRYNYVIYQDANPELALERDVYEKEKIGGLLDLKYDDLVLDIGCGVGRWGDEVIKYLTQGKYVGIDYSGELLKIAEQNFKDTDKCCFVQGSFQNVEQVLKEHEQAIEYDKILINGVLMYINDEEISNCLESVNHLLKKNGRIYIKESVGIQKRFTLKDFYSEELSSNYNAIYRGLKEYEELFKQSFSSQKYDVISNGVTWHKEQENRKETTSYYWIFKKK